MRLSPETQQLITQQVHKFFSADSDVWLFGSRCDDAARGGDIDLYIETPDIDTIVQRKINLKIALTDALGEQKIDIVVHNRHQPMQPIHRIAKEQGQLLR